MSMYTCIGTNDYGSDEKSVQIEVHYQPNIPWPLCSIDSSAIGIFLQDGDEMTIICETEGGNPLPTLTWFNGSREVQRDYIVEPECDWDCIATNTYTWTLQKYDNGITCTCEGHHQETQNQGNCAVGPFDIKYSPDEPVCRDNAANNPSYKEDDHVLISCESMDGNPSATLVWFNETDQQELVKISPDPEDSGSIKLKYDWEITRADNQGEFRCEATNIVQLSPLTCSHGPFNVHFPPNEPECCQTNISGYTGSVLEGEFLQLSCTSCSGNPAADIKWFKNDMELTLDTNETRELLDGAHNGKISHAKLIEEVKHTDNGVTYRCEATSEDVFPTHTYPSADIVICVHYAPKIREQENDKTVVVFEAEDAELVCNITSNPSADIVWLDQNKEPILNETNNRTIQETTRDTLIQSVLILHDVSRKDTGIYTCVANNSIGRVTQELSVDVIGMGNFPTFAAIAISLAVIIITAAALLFIVYKRRHTKNEPTKEDETQADRNLYAELQLNREDGECGGKQEYMGLVFSKGRSVTVKDETCYANKVCLEVTDNGDEENGHGDRYEIPYRSIDFGRDMSIGIFTKLVEANVLSRGGKRIRVCVKILRENEIKMTENCLLTEARFMKTIPKHTNILEMIYCCTKEIPNCMVFEYCSSGTLKHHLLTCKQETENVIEDCIVRDLYSFALQIAKGMSYLEDIECVHRTLSSKSVHVDRGNICKITEFGLSSKVITENTFETVTEGRLPIRWMALESILDCIYTSKTDVWSYGVVLWEIFTLGETPYSGITIRDIIRQLQQGYRLPKPDYSDERMFGIIEQCWLREAAERPTFHQLGSFIELGHFQNKNHIKIYEDVPDEDTI